MVAIERRAKPSRVKDKAGMVFGNWTVLSYFGVKRYEGTRSQAQYWLCRCSCGSEEPVQASSLVAGTSGGCRNCNQDMHGHTVGGVRHYMYNSWQTMLSRCRNPRHIDYKNYGARGIIVCKRWEKFQHFLDDVGNRPEGKTLDRINVDGNYEPGNTRWATHSEQMKNRRKWSIKHKDCHSGGTGEG